MKKIVICVFLSSCLMTQLPAQENATTQKEGIVVGRYNPSTGVVTSDGSTTKFRQKGSNVRVAFDVGFSYRTAKVYESSYSDFYRGMRDGFLYGGDIHGFFPSNIGLGGKFTGHYYSNSQGGMESKVNTYYFAPSVIWRGFTAKRDSYNFGISAGYLSYSESASFMGQSISMTKGGFGMTLDFGYDIRLEKNSFLGFRLTLTDGVVDAGTEKSTGKKMKESFAAIDLATGIRF